MDGHTLLNSFLQSSSLMNRAPILSNQLNQLLTSGIQLTRKKHGTSSQMRRRNVELAREAMRRKFFGKKGRGGDVMPRHNHCYLARDLHFPSRYNRGNWPVAWGSHPQSCNFTLYRCHCLWHRVFCLCVTLCGQELMQDFPCPRFAECP